MNPPVKFNPRLIWDYDITEKDLEREDVLLFYISRVLNRGTMSDIHGIPLELIEKNLDRLLISRRIRRFWEWYFGTVLKGTP
jgi:hypothetical protein